MSWSRLARHRATAATTTALSIYKHTFSAMKLIIYYVIVQTNSIIFPRSRLTVFLHELNLRNIGGVISYELCNCAHFSLRQWADEYTVHLRTVMLPSLLRLEDQVNLVWDNDYLPHKSETKTHTHTTQDTHCCNEHDTAIDLHASSDASIRYIFHHKLRFRNFSILHKHLISFCESYI